MTWTTQPRSERHGMAAIVAGEGPLVLLLHGVGLRAEAWARIQTHLAAGWEVVAPDMPGHGLSAHQPGMEALEDYARVLRPLMERPCHLVGHSMGAMLALRLASDVPSRVLSVTALNGIFERKEGAKLAVRARADHLDGQTVPDPGPALDRWFGKTSSPERMACETWLREVDPAGYRSAYRVFAREDGPSRDQLAQLTCPALFITGGQEPNSTPAMSRAMAALCPKGQAEVLEDAAHMLPMTHADQLAPILTHFLQHTTPKP
ncbi:MAG: alpha/beta hydrolase [Pseudomonadota bacterium]